MLLRWSPIVALLLSVLLGGCGQKGPLYMPDEPERIGHSHSSAAATPESATEQTEDQLQVEEAATVEPMESEAMDAPPPVELAEPEPEEENQP